MLQTRTLVEDFSRLMDILKPDVVHAGPLHGPAFIAARAGFSPLVSMSWGSDILHAANHSLIAYLKIQYTLNHSTILVGDCQAVADKAAAMNFPAERVFRFPWGVNLQHFCPTSGASLREKLGWQDKFVFLSNRSFEKIYGVDVLMRGFIRAAKLNPNIRLLILGKGSQEAYLKKLVADAGISEKVHFGGFSSLNDLPGTYCTADVYVSASHSDGSSVSLMEALACGRPALVSAIPSNLEWVNNQSNGWIFRDGSSRDLAEKMCAAAESKNLDDIGKAARKTAENKADWSKNFPVLLQAYQAACDIHQSEEKAAKQS